MRSWSEAWEDALYGPSGFFLREVPGHHFRTNVAVPLFAVAVRRLADLVDLALGRPDPFDVVDLGAGRGELLSSFTDVPSRWRLTSVDLAPGLPSDLPELEGLLIANEYLDSVPLDVVSDGRLVLVSPDGTEHPGAPLASEWAASWWPSSHLSCLRSPDPRRDAHSTLEEGHEELTSSPQTRQATSEGATARRVEIGASRDLAWAAATARVRRGLAVAIDYGHTVDTRRPTLTGYRDGIQVRPTPDGTCDITAHVALDSVAAATGSVLVSQRDALRALGVSAALPRPDDPAYRDRLVQSSQARELLDPDGLGGFGWVLRAVDAEIGWMGT